jgi:hypothetical protein
MVLKHNLLHLEKNKFLPQLAGKISLKGLDTHTSKVKNELNKNKR